MKQIVSHLFNIIIEKTNFKAVAIAEVLHLGLTLTQLVSWGISAVSGIIVIAGGLLAARNYILKGILLKKQIELEDQKNHDYWENKNKEVGPHERKG